MVGIKQIMETNLENRVENGLCLFYESFLSQWYPCTFIVDGITFKSAEMYMMWAKNAVFNGSYEDAILSSTHPAECKKYGRMIENFNPEIWDDVAKHFVFVGNIAKFTQNKDLYESLLSIECDRFVECSPTDKIWGIGLELSDPNCKDRSMWKGTNWLGDVITDVRNCLTNIMINLKSYYVYEVEFIVGLSTAQAWRKWRRESYTTKILAKELDEVLNFWPNHLMENFPYEDGSGGSHYSTYPIYGDQIKFVSIKVLHDDVKYIM